MALITGIVGTIAPDSTVTIVGEDLGAVSEVVLHGADGVDVPQVIDSVTDTEIVVDVVIGDVNMDEPADVEVVCTETGNDVMEGMPVVFSRTEKRLSDLGYTGQVNDKMSKYLDDKSHEGTLDDKIRKELRSLGYTGPISEMLKQKADAEGFRSVSEMMTRSWVVSNGDI